MQPVKRYDAFISYSHSDCGLIAPEIQKAVENIGKPWYGFNKRNLTVFRDETNLSANPELWNNIKSALERSKHLILLASPLAATSRFVNMEVNWWLENHRTKSIFIVVTKGEIAWDSNSNKDFNWDTTDCLPHILKGKFESEPLG